MSKGRKTTVIDMQMRTLNEFDRVLRNAGRTEEGRSRGIYGSSGLLRNAPVDKWSDTPGLKKLSGVEKRIAELKRQLEA